MCYVSQGFIRGYLWGGITYLLSEVPKAHHIIMIIPLTCCVSPPPPTGWNPGLDLKYNTCSYSQIRKCMHAYYFAADPDLEFLHYYLTMGLCLAVAIFILLLLIATLILKQVHKRRIKHWIGKSESDNDLYTKTVFINNFSSAYIINNSM